MSLYNWIRSAYALTIRHPVSLLVYQMGKVGSSSTYRSLSEAGLKPVHVHYIYSDLPHMDRFTETSKDFPFHFYVGRVLWYYLRLTSHRLKIITLVRDPIARYISAQFQTLGHEPIARDDPNTAVRQLQDTVRRGEKVTFNWFEREMEPLLGVNPIDEPFDCKAGHALIEAPRADVLVLKLERLSDLIPDVVGPFVGKKLTISRANVGKGKNYAGYYQEVLERFCLTEEECRRVYSHPHIKHFYSPEEIDEFVQQWTGRSISTTK